MRRGLQVVLAAAALVAVAGGLAALIAGTRQVLGPDPSSANVDSEFRFFAAWYVVAGVLMLRAVPNIEREGRIVRAVAAGFFLAACGRVISILAVGGPSSLYIALMVVEFAFPVAIVPWHHRLVISSSAHSLDSG